MKILLAGGGSGGHLTPLIAVADAIKKRSPETIIAYIGQCGENLQEVMSHEAVVERYLISAGKFRRYHGKSILSQLSDIRTVLLNVRDFFRFLAGLWQSWWLLRKIKPDAIFLKGGFVCVPVGFAARLRKVPYITHDSDAVPGLANRLTAKNARYNTTAMPTSLYPYDPSKALQVGIPLQPEYEKVTPAKQEEAKVLLGYDVSDKIILCSGGGLGAQKINRALATGADNLLQEYKNLNIIHITGKKLLAETEVLYEQSVSPEQLKRVRLIDFSSALYRLSAAADIIVMRAGATSIAEAAAQAKACVVIPAPHLTGGQQLHNAEVLSKSGAAIIVTEKELPGLAEVIKDTLKKPPSYRMELGEKLHELWVPGASEALAELLINVASDSRQKK